MIEGILPGDPAFSAEGVASEETFPLTEAMTFEAADPETNAAEATPTAASPTTGALQNVTTFFYAWDHLGTIRLVSNQDRTLLERHDYEPFGVELRPILNQTQNTHQFTGHERDQASEYDYMHARYYGSNLARFMRPDPVPGKPGNPQSFNLYAYVQNRPTVATDPLGLATYLVVVGTSDNATGQAALGNQALKVEQQIKRLPGFNPKEDKVVTKLAASKSDFQKAVGEKYSSGQLARVDVVAHTSVRDTPTMELSAHEEVSSSGEHSIYFSGKQDTQLQSSDFKAINKSDVTADFQVGLWGCHSAEETMTGQSSLARQVAKTLDAPAQGVIGPIVYPLPLPYTGNTPVMTITSDPTMISALPW
jgi:RHS repeat-associated protein